LKDTANKFEMIIYNFRLSAIFHIVPGKTIAAVGTGTPVEISQNYFVLNIGFKLFRIDTN